MHEQMTILRNVLVDGTIKGARIRGTSVDVDIKDGHIESIHESRRLDEPNESKSGRSFSASGGLLAPSLCHPHVHLDKAFILSHPRYRHLQITEGTFQEAMELTSEAKKSFTRDDLIQRGQRLIEESWQAGVTHMRAFVEVDEIVGMSCVEAGAELKKMAAEKGLCHVQLCAFAQLPLHPSDASGDKIRSLMQQAMQPQHLVDVVGSTPYVEKDRSDEIANIKWMIDLALKHDKHLDFHLDYNVNPDTEPTVFEVVRLLKESEWAIRTRKCIVFGHCTRQLYFDMSQWQHLASQIGDLPISFVGLPTSDLYMMKTPSQQRPTTIMESRTTLPIPQMIQKYGLNCAIGMNNIGNAFTPQGVCDPLFLANLGVAIYHTGTVKDARLLYECISTRARAAIGLASSSHDGDYDFTLDILPGQRADLILFQPPPEGFEGEENIEDKVYYYSAAPRTALWSGN
ncbi:Metallo-dependent hydrolase [Myriangium duriaei CBS 260.36]|uniref:Metallo-dependent hydrolase n=1 Tax=Myriangium duriaei CBS 260.36 TaxID=1168546 RepID=A0A9P4MJ23_9PEZI|nr:Metallo-dependent hydrolase [Myriangium duriaei CBS 260.36]